MERLSTFFAADCASVTFDRAGRIVTICVGARRPAARDARPAHARPARGVPASAAPARSGEPVHRLRGRRLLLSRQPRPRGDPDDHTATSGWSSRPTGRSAPGSRSTRDYDVSGVAEPRRQAVLGAARLVGPDLVGLPGRRRRHDRPGLRRGPHARHDEQITNSFAVDETGGVYIVTDAALYRFDAGAGRHARRSPGARSIRTAASASPARSSPGSGTTPTLVGSGYVAITDNADPMDVVVYKRARSVQRIAPGLHAAGVRAGRGRDRQLADRGRPLADRREQLRVQRGRRRRRRAPRPRPGSSAWTSPTAAALQDACGEATRSRPRSCRSCRSRPGSSTRTRSRRPSGNDAVVLHRDRLPQRADRLQAAGGHRPRASTTTMRRSRSAPTAPPTWARWAGSCCCATGRPSVQDDRREQAADEQAAVGPQGRQPHRDAGEVRDGRSRTRPRRRSRSPPRARHGAHQRVGPVAPHRAGTASRIASNAEQPRRDERRAPRRSTTVEA